MVMAESDITVAFAIETGCNLTRRLSERSAAIGINTLVFIQSRYMRSYDGTT